MMREIMDALTYLWENAGGGVEGAPQVTAHQTTEKCLATGMFHSLSHSLTHYSYHVELEQYVLSGTAESLVSR